MQIDRRGVIASVLSFVYPGLGHVYLREWVRAFAWFALALVTAALLVPDAAYQAVENGGMDALLAFQFPMYVTAGLLVVRLLNVVDAYFVAVKQTMPTRADEPACPHCGSALDAELDFCPWCTTEIEWVQQPDQSDSN